MWRSWDVRLEFFWIDQGIKQIAQQEDGDSGAEDQIGQHERVHDGAYVSRSQPRTPRTARPNKRKPRARKAMSSMARSPKDPNGVRRSTRCAREP